MHTSREREREQETDPGTNGQCVTDVGKSIVPLFPTPSHWNCNRMIPAHTILEFMLCPMPNTQHMCFAVYLSELSCLYYSLYKEWALQITLKASGDGVSGTNGLQYFAVMCSL